MSLQNLIEEREKELNENFEWTDFSGDLGNFVLVKKQSDYSTEDTQRNDLKKFHSTSINLILDGVVEMIDKDFRWLDRSIATQMVLDSIISQLQTLKK